MAAAERWDPGPADARTGEPDGRGGFGRSLRVGLTWLWDGDPEHGAAELSTVWLGPTYTGRPTQYQTRVRVPGEEDGYLRYTTRAQAEDGHRSMVRLFMVAFPGTAEYAQPPSPADTP